MKKSIALLFALALLMTLLPGALAQGESLPGGTLVVTGTAGISLKADMATIEIGAMTRGKTMGEAHQQNAAIMEKVIAEMEKLGIAKEDVHTSQYNVYFEQDNSISSSVQHVISGNYVVTNMLQITIRDIGKVSQAIDAAAAAGANNVYNLTFQSSASKEGYHQALREAVNDAKAKAEVLAQSAGYTLGSVLKIESNDSMGTPYGAGSLRAYDAAEAKATPILSGDVTVSAWVVLTFSLK